MNTFDIENKKKKALEHYYQVEEKFLSMTQPLKHLGIKDWGYIKCRHDGQYLNYSTTLKFVEDHIAHIQSSSPLFQKIMLQTDDIVKKFYIQGNIQEYDTKNDPVLDLLYQNNGWNSFGIYNIGRTDGMDGWLFSLGHEARNIESFFKKAEPYLERFITYFESIAPEYCDLSDEKTLSVYEENFSFFEKSDDDHFHDHTLEFLRETTLKKLTIKTPEGDIHLTQRQGQALYYLAQYHSVKEIAKILELSPRTIETYIQNIKDKIGASSRSDLMRFIQQYALENKLNLFI